MPPLCFTAPMLRRLTLYDLPPHWQPGPQFAGDTHPEARLLRRHLRAGEGWCCSSKGRPPSAGLTLLPAEALAHLRPDTFHALAPLLPGNPRHFLWAACGWGSAPEEIAGLLSTAQHRAALQGRQLALCTYYRHRQALAPLFKAGFGATALRQMAYLRPCFLFLPTAANQKGQRISLQDSYTLSRRMEEGWQGVALAGDDMVLAPSA